MIWALPWVAIAVILVQFALVDELPAAAMAEIVRRGGAGS